MRSFAYVGKAASEVKFGVFDHVRPVGHPMPFGVFDYVRPVGHPVRTFNESLMSHNFAIQTPNPEAFLPLLSSLDPLSSEPGSHSITDYMDLGEDAMECTLDGSIDLWGEPARRRRTGGFKRAFFVLVNQGLVCVALYGVSANLVIYLTSVLREGDSSAASNTSNWQGALYFFSVIGGFVGDAYLGRYRSSLLFQLLAISGLVLVSLSATIPAFHPRTCEDGSTSCVGASKLQINIFYAAIYIIAVGYGCYQPNIISFGADQFDDEHSLEAVQKLKFFNWFYVSLTLGTLLSGILLVYIENKGKWALAYWISSGAGVVALCLFLFPTRAYRFHHTGGNPLCRVAQVVVAAIRKRHVKPPCDSVHLYEVGNGESAIKGSRKIHHTKSLRFFDKAATIIDNDIDKSEIEERGPQIATNTWRLCTVTQVEEVKWLCRVLPIWVCTIFYTTAYTQVYSLFVIQGAAMNTHVGGLDVPPATLYAVDCVTVVISIVAYNGWLMPLARRWTGRAEGLTGLQRIGIGMPIVAVAMLEAGLVEMVRLRKRVGGGNISILWQIPLYITTGISETFTYIGQMHFFYDQAPDAMRSIGSTLPQTSVALGNYLNTLLMLIISRLTGTPGWIPDSDSIDSGHIDYYFFLLFVLTLFNFALFFLLSMQYKYANRQDMVPPTQTLQSFPDNQSPREEHNHEN